MGQFDTVVEELSKLNSEVKAEAFLLPSITAKKIDELWNKIQKLIIESAKKYAPNMKYIHTISLGSDVLNDEGQIERVIEYAEEWDQRIHNYRKQILYFSVSQHSILSIVCE